MQFLQRRSNDQRQHQQLVDVEGEADRRDDANQPLGRRQAEFRLACGHGSVTRERVIEFTALLVRGRRSALGCSALPNLAISRAAARTSAPREPNAERRPETAMTSFDFQPRTRVVFGAGSVARTRRAGARTWVSPDAARGRCRPRSRPGMSRRPCAPSTAAGIAAIPFHDFGQNPDSAMVEAGRAFAAPLGDRLAPRPRRRQLDGLRQRRELPVHQRRADERLLGRRQSRETNAPDDRRSPRPPAPAARPSRSQLISDAQTHIKMACGDKKAACKIAILDPTLTGSRSRNALTRHSPAFKRNRPSPRNPRHPPAKRRSPTRLQAPQTWSPASLGKPSKRFSRRPKTSPPAERCNSAPASPAWRSKLHARRDPRAPTNPLHHRFRPAARPGDRDHAPARRPLERADSSRAIRGPSLGSIDAAAASEHLARTLERIRPRPEVSAARLQDHGVPARCAAGTGRARRRTVDRHLQPKALRYCRRAARSIRRRTRKLARLGSLA